MPAKRNSWRLGAELYCLCIVLIPFAFAGPLAAKPVLTVLPAGTTATAINDSGVVVGTTVAGNTVGFVRTPDGMTTTFSAASGAIATLPQSINAAGVITGHYVVQGPLYHAFVRAADGTITTFDGPNAGTNNTFAFGINSEGVITGAYYDQTGILHAFVRAVDGTITSFDAPGAAYTEATDINDAGEIVGYWTDTVQHGFVRSASGTFTSFDAPGSPLTTLASDINGKGAVTGFYIDQMNAVHGYIRQRNGAFTTFDVGSGPTYPATINDAGTVAGDGGLTSKGQFKGFVRRRNGDIRAFSWPKSDTSTSRINNQGVVVGSFDTYSHHISTNYGFIWTP